MRFAARVAAARLADADRLALRCSSNSALPLGVIWLSAICARCLAAARAQAERCADFSRLAVRAAAAAASWAAMTARLALISASSAASSANRASLAVLRSGAVGASETVVRHKGHVVARRSHHVIHVSWKTWPHVVRCSAPSAMTSRHTGHSMAGRVSGDPVVERRPVRTKPSLGGWRGAGVVTWRGSGDVARDGQGAVSE